MGFVEIVIVFFIALAIASLFFYGFRSRGPWGAFWVFLLILFLSAWVGRLWLTPAGPVLWGFAWLPVMFFVLIIALAIAVASPREEDRTVDYEPETGTEIRESDRGVAAVFGVFFWTLLIVLIVAVIAGLIR